MAAITAASAIVVLGYLLRTNLSEHEALGAAAVAAAGTGIWSVASDAMWAHGPAILLLLVCLLAWVHGRVMVLVVAAAISVAVRPSVALALGVIAVAGARRGRAHRSIGVGLGTILGLATVSAYSAWAFGELGPVAGYAARTHLDGLWEHSPWQTIRDLLLSLVSPTRGVFTLSPIVPVAVLALVRRRNHLPDWSMASATAGAVLLLFHVRTTSYQGGTGFFGYRIQLEALFLAVPAFAFALFSVARDSVIWRRAALLAISVSAGIQAFGAIAQPV